MLSTAPSVSIGIPTFNRAATLTHAIESVLSQDHPNLEIVISDNASSDETQAICAEFSGRDDRVRYVRQPENRGAFANFLDVLQRANGDYFMWLSDDDYLGESYLSRCVAVLESRPDVALACGISRYHDHDVVAFEGVKVDLQQEDIGERVLSFYRQVSDNGTFYGLVRRELLLNNTMPNVLGGDWLLIARLAATGKIVTLDDVAVYRSSRGASADVRALALSLGFSAKKARQPHNSIAASVARDILRADTPYAKLSAVARILLAIRSARMVQRRFVDGEYPLRTLASKVKARILQRQGVS